MDKNELLMLSALLMDEIMSMVGMCDECGCMLDAEVLGVDVNKVAALYTLIMEAVQE